MPQTQWDKVAFNQVSVDGKAYYFSYPVNAALADGNLIFGDCKIGFGKEVNLENEFRYKLKNNGGYKYEAWYDLSDLLVIYRASIDGFSFWSENSDLGVTGCVDLIHYLANSFSDHPKYINDRFEFSVELPEFYDAEYLSDNAGILLKREMSVEVEEGTETYTVEIVVLPFENLKNYEDLNAFVADDYGDFSLEYVTYDDVAGFYVDQETGLDAIKHFYTMRSGDDFIFEAYLKLPSKYYGTHKDEFVEMVKSLDLF